MTPDAPRTEAPDLRAALTQAADAMDLVRDGLMVRESDAVVISAESILRHAAREARAALSSATPAPLESHRPAHRPAEPWSADELASIRARHARHTGHCDGCVWLATLDATPTPLDPDVAAAVRAWLANDEKGLNGAMTDLAARLTEADR